MNKKEDKWLLLYEYSRKALDDEINRFARLDEKAIKLLTATSIIITIFIALSKWLFSENTHYFTTYVYLLSGLLFILLCIAWGCYFMSLKLTIVPKMPLTDEVLNLFKDRNIPTIYIALYKSTKIATEKLSSIIHKKAKYLVWGFNCTSIAGLLLIVFTGMVVLESNKTQVFFCKNKIETQHKEVTIMCNEEDEPNNGNITHNQQSDNEPDFDVDAPSLQIATEGFEVPNSEPPLITKDE